MLKKIAIGFVIYDPNLNQLNRIHEASRLGFSVYVYDNSPDKINAKEFAKNRQDVVYLTCGKNVGLGRGMASVCAQAYYDGHSALVFFDQDTIFSNETLDFIENYYQNNLNLSGTYSAVVFNSKGSGEILEPDCLREVDMAINSGSLFFLENLKNIGWHNVNYFVDCVDYEFCLKSQIAGLKIGEYICTPGYDHSKEQDDKEYEMFGKVYRLRAYPFFRIMDTLKASSKLLVAGVIAGKFKFSIRVARLLFMYMGAQIITRVLIPANSKSREEV